MSLAAPPRFPQTAGVKASRKRLATTGGDIEHLGLERGHRTLTITREGGKVVVSSFRLLATSPS
jgi:hypothetical protein